MHRIVEGHARTTLREDIDIIQIGLKSKGYDRGVLMVNRDRPTSAFSVHPTVHWQDQRRSATGVHGEY